MLRTRTSSMVSLALLMLACLIMATATRPMPVTTTAGLLASSSTSNARALLQHLGSTVDSSALLHLMTKPVNHASQKAASNLAKVGSSWLVQVVPRLLALCFEAFSSRACRVWPHIYTASWTLHAMHPVQYHHKPRQCFCSVMLAQVLWSSRAFWPLYTASSTLHAMQPALLVTALRQHNMRLASHCLRHRPSYWHGQRQQQPQPHSSCRISRT
jgi:hypothetical protein